MAWIPEDAKWYLAEVVIEIKVEGASENVVHRNTHLIRADSPDEAYSKAVEIGRAEDYSYKNSDGKEVWSIFRGLRNLLVIYEELEDGAELMYSEQVGVSEEESLRMTRSKSELAVYLPRTWSNGPNYFQATIAEELKQKYPDVDWRKDA